MAGTERNRELKNLSYIETDLLQSKCNLFDKKMPMDVQVVEEEEEIELSLGLSLNGRFGFDPERAKKITRASSISNFMITCGENESKSWSLGGVGGQYDAGLARTSSLPAETEESRKRKELQSLRRMEVKRKRLEKLKNVRVVREKGDLVVESNGQQDNGENVVLGNGGVEEVNGEGKLQHFSSQSSIGSQGSGGSSGVSDFESQPIIGKSKEDRSAASAQTPSKKEEEKTDKPVEAVVVNPPPRIAASGKEVKEAMKNMMADMPCVSTRGDNGRRIEGFLYRYRNGEEVKIVCVCHGSFLSPAEFVKHAGGGDVANPLKHIVINPTPFV